jgi:hypothetical protein
LIGGEFVIEFRAHDSSNLCHFAAVLPSQSERDATAMCPDFDAGMAGMMVTEISGNAAVTSACQ